MGGGHRKPAKKAPVGPDETPQIPAHEPERTWHDRLWEGVDIAISRALAVAVVVAIVRGQVTLELVATLYATLGFLKIARSGR
jgi:hypothetical protein